VVALGSVHPRFAVNCSILFTELPLLERPAAVRAAGFDAMELWWPFDRAVPSDAEVDALEAAIRDAGVALVGLNFAAGDMPGGDRGLVSWAERSSEFRENVPVALGIGERLGCKAFNALYGNRVQGVDPDEQDALAVENLSLAAAAADAIGATVLVEPLSGAPRYPLLTAADAVGVIGEVERQSSLRNVGLLADLYHLAVNGEDLDKVLERYADWIAHVQIADAPGRHEPGTGTVPFDDLLATLGAGGYDGWVGLEYKPSGDTVRSFDWARHGGDAERR
jgi:hydroxypyruvate isomerase